MHIFLKSVHIWPAVINSYNKGPMVNNFCWKKCNQSRKPQIFKYFTEYNNIDSSIIYIHIYISFSTPKSILKRHLWMIFLFSTSYLHWHLQCNTCYLNPKGIYRRNIGDYLRQPYLWVKYRWSSSAIPFLWSIMSEFTIIYCYKRYSAHNRQ